MTDRNDAIQQQEAHAQEVPPVLITPNRNDHRPLDTVIAAGPPVPSIPFDPARFERGKRMSNVLVVCMHNGRLQQQRADQVLFRDYSHEFPDDNDGGISRIQEAYWPSRYKETMPTIMGHVEICHVLTRCEQEQQQQQQQGSSSSEGVDNIVFQLTNRYVAVKVNYTTRMDRLAGQHTEDPMKEIAAMQLLGDDPHPNVMGVVDVLFDDQNNLNVIMPYCSMGDLFDYMNNPQRPEFTEPEARRCFQQIMNGIQFLQSKGICHRDLSPENIMMDDNGCVIIDLGMAIRIPYEDSNGNITDIQHGGIQKRLIQPQRACGKWPYMSPEMFANHRSFFRRNREPFNPQPYDGTAIDIWTAGVVLFCMVTGNKSYDIPHDSNIQYYWMTNGLRTLLQQWNINLSEECMHLLENTIQTDPRLRLTLEEVMEHPWLNM